ncbi:uncharacterized protein LOC110110178 isoform X3 [Dendrobium catenatum]|uniref:uncharacterized protein LOC110110178 isoform X3 n=1 Tax=Dendrobium catenatum TaxID=906689 RepID=UPI0009F3ED81|nr:uncharacterized protein LOC110110178 isoform X3 [Dendrobium catenatum]
MGVGSRDRRRIFAKIPERRRLYSGIAGFWQNLRDLAEVICRAWCIKEWRKEVNRRLAKKFRGLDALWEAINSLNRQMDEVTSDLFRLSVDMHREFQALRMEAGVNHVNRLQPQGAGRRDQKPDQERSCAPIVSKSQIRRRKAWDSSMPICLPTQKVKLYKCSSIIDAGVQHLAALKENFG